MKKILLRSSILVICFMISICFTTCFAAEESSQNELEEKVQETLIENENEAEKTEKDETIETSKKTEENETIEKAEKTDDIEEVDDKSQKEETKKEENEKAVVEENETSNNILENIEEQEETKSPINQNTAKSSNFEDIEISAGNSSSDQNSQSQGNISELQDGLYTIKSATNPNLVVDVFGAERKTGSQIGLWVSNYAMNQQFYVSRLPNSSYTIQARYSGYVFDIYNNNKTEGTQVIQWISNNQDNQKFYIVAVGDGTYNIISACSGLYLDVDTPGLAKTGSTIRIMNKNDLLTQKFIFEKVEQVYLSGVTPVEDGTYQIAFFEDNNKVITINNGLTTSCANVEVQNNYGGFNQKFNIKHNSDGTYNIQAVHSGKMLDVYNNDVGTGTNIEQYAANNGVNQKWILNQNSDGSIYIISKSNELNLSAAVSFANGTNIYCNSKNIDEKYRKFILIPVSLKESEKVIEDGSYKILSAINQNLAFDIEGVSQNNGANLELWTRNSGSNQKFKINYINGYYTIIPVHSNKSIDVCNASVLPNTNVLQWQQNGQYNQQWILEETEDGYYKICSRKSYMYLSTSSSVGAGSNVFVAEDLGDVLNQKFLIIKAEVVGIDVSEWNNNIDWNQVAQTQDFAIVRVGYRGYRNPRLVLDSKFTQNMQGATNAGMNVGAYFFTTAINEAEAIEEANWTANMLSPYKVSYPVAIDVEWTNGNHDGRSDYLSKEDRTRVVKAFCETIKARGYTPMIYASRDWLYYYLDMSQLQGYDVWLAHYTSGGLSTPTNYTGTYTTWQYSSKGYVPGVNGYVDMNICYSPY